MRDSVLFLAGAAFGAGMMYALDPDAGRRRRALTRDQWARARIKTRETASATARDLLNRSYGIMAVARSRLFETEVEEEVLEQRVRSKFGYVVRNPSAIQARVDSGRVILTGAVRADEVNQLIAEVSAVRGVRAVENRLDVHDDRGHVPELQSADKPKPTRQPVDLFRRRWSPVTRLLVLVSAAGAAVYAFTRPPFFWTALTSLGLAGYASAGKDGGRALLLRRLKGKQVNALYDPLSTGCSS